jgi:hypothetical protein
MNTPLRHYCRNPRCRSKLKAPVENHHHACTPGCHASFYRSRCLVCENVIRRKNEQQKLGSGHGRCRADYDRFRHVYDYPSHHTSKARGPLKNPIKPGVKTGDVTARPWRQIAGSEMSARTFALATLPLDPATADRADRANAKAWADAAVIELKDAPINLLGGHRFATAPKLDPFIRLAILSIETEVEEPTTVGPNTPVANGDPFALPEFLRR